MVCTVTFLMKYETWIYVVFSFQGEAGDDNESVNVLKVCKSILLYLIYVNCTPKSSICVKVNIHKLNLDNF